MEIVEIWQNLGKKATQIMDFLPHYMWAESNNGFSSDLYGPKLSHLISCFREQLTGAKPTDKMIWFTKRSLTILYGVYRRVEQFSVKFIICYQPKGKEKRSAVKI